MTIYDYGVDLDSSFTFQDGDLKLKEYTNNIGQAIANRLNTLQDSLDLFYEDYGSYFIDYLGWRKNQTTLNFMKVELDSTLAKDPRIKDFNTELEFNKEGNAEIHISLEDGSDTTLNFVLGMNGIEIINEEETEEY